MSRRRTSRGKTPREPSQNPWTAILYGVRYEYRAPIHLLAEADERHSFRIPTVDVMQFGKLRSIDRAGAMNFVRLADGSIYRVAFLSQTRAARKWIRMHNDRCAPPSLVTPEGSRRLQAMRWLDALRFEDVPAAELARVEPLLADESRRFGKS